MNQPLPSEWCITIIDDLISKDDADCIKEQLDAETLINSTTFHQYQINYYTTENWMDKIKLWIYKKLITGGN